MIIWAYGQYAAFYALIRPFVWMDADPITSFELLLHYYLTLAMENFYIFYVSSAVEWQSYLSEETAVSTFQNNSLIATRNFVSWQHLA